jgi:hypothetical protein
MRVWVTFIWDINSYAGVQWTKMAQFQSSVLTSKVIWKFQVHWNAPKGATKD